MRLYRASLWCAAALTVLLSVPSTSPVQAEGRTVIVGTGATTGVYNLVGALLCRYVNARSEANGLLCQIEPSAGSLANLQGLRSKDIAMGLSQEGRIQLAAAQADGKALRHVMALHTEAVTLVARPGTGIASLADLRGKRVLIGQPQSGTRALALLALEDAAVPDVQRVEDISPNEQGAALCQGKIDAFFYVVGHPSQNIDTAIRLCDAVLVPIDGAVAQRLTANNPYLRTVQIPAGTYEGQSAAVQTVGVRSVLATRADVPERIVYEFTRSVVARLDSLKRSHPGLAGLTIRTMAEAPAGVPIHDGALRAYREAVHPEVGETTGSSADSASVTIIFVSDISRISDRGPRADLARVAALVERERSSRRSVILVHGGNGLSPSIAASFTKGAHMIEILNAIDVDLMVAGRSDFEFGPEQALRRFKQARFPVLAANVRAASGSALDGLSDTWIESVGGFSIGFVGLSSRVTPLVSPVNGLVFSDQIEAAKQKIEALRARKVDLVVGVADATEEERRALEAAGLFDILYTSGGGAEAAARTDGHKVVLHTGAKRSVIAAVDVELQRTFVDAGVRFIEGSGQSKGSLVDMTPAEAKAEVEWWPGIRLANVERLEPDPPTALIMQGWLRAVPAGLGKPIARIAMPLDGSLAALNSGQSTLGAVITDAMRVSTGADAALLPAGAMRGWMAYLKDDTFSAGDMLRELPDWQAVEVVELDGAALLRALEFGLSGAGAEDGRFPQVSGLRVRYDPAKPDGAKIVSAEINGARVKRGARYRLAVTDFTAEGGYGYAMLAKAKALTPPDERVALQDVVIHYLRWRGKAEAADMPRIVRP